MHVRVGHTIQYRAEDRLSGFRWAMVLEVRPRTVVVRVDRELVEVDRDLIVGVE